MARLGQMPARDHAALRASAQRLRHELQAMGRGADEYGWIHGDLHLWNLLFRGREAGAIDFSDGGLGHHAHDLAKTLQYLHAPLPGFQDHSPMAPRMREQLLAGYARHRALPPDVEHQIDVYLAVHALNTVEWILAAWPRPDARPWGPAFLAGAAASLRPWQA
jgi:Ser/Thr protein kinase RdoA (MazF antagonist)